MKRLSKCLALVLLVAGTSYAGPYGMKTGTPDLKSAGALAFGPDGVLFVGDTKAATVFAIDTGDVEGDPGEVDHHVQGIDQKVAELLQQETVTINDLAVDLRSGTAYFSVSYGEQKTPAIVRIHANGELHKLTLENVNFSKVSLPNPPEDKVQGGRQRNPRDESITDIAFSDGRLLVSGLSSDSAASKVRELLFPFEEADQGVSIEIFHGAHGRYEDHAAVKTFVPFHIDGQPHLLAGFTCTPLVKFPLNELAAGEKVRGTTVAELGNRNQPYDMIVYERDGQDFLLMANSARGVMKISTDDIERRDGITKQVSRGGKAGQEYETIESLKGVVQLDRLNAGHAVIVVKNEDGSHDLHTVDLP